jgi:hypothetical protein
MTEDLQNEYLDNEDINSSRSASIAVMVNFPNRYSGIFTPDVIGVFKDKVTYEAFKSIRETYGLSESAISVTVTYVTETYWCEADVIDSLYECISSSEIADAIELTNQFADEAMDTGDEIEATPVDLSSVVAIPIAANIKINQYGVPIRIEAEKTCPTCHGTGRYMIPKLGMKTPTEWVFCKACRSTGRVKAE